ncbi:MAG: hypothetical protein RL641_577 [Candidatus Parcubacteria bacterium]|jgi:hypothetical protein
MENKNRKTLLWAIVVILLIVGAVIFAKNREDGLFGTGGPDVTTEPVSTEDTSAGGTSTPTGSAMSYTNAVTMYADRRIQLDKTCQARPNNVTYKNGTSIMVDNRSPQSVKVRLGSTFTIKPYGFKIVKLSSATLPATLLVDCGVAQNVATVLIQK